MNIHSGCIYHTASFVLKRIFACFTCFDCSKWLDILHNSWFTAPALGFQSLIICSLQIMHNHNGCHCMILLHCVLWNTFSQKSSKTACTIKALSPWQQFWLTPIVHFKMLSKFARSKIMPPHTDCDCLIFSTVHKNKIRWFHCSISSNFFCCAFSNAFRNPFLKQMQTHIHYISLTFLHCTVRFQMLSKIACPKKGTITFVAFV